MRRPGLGSVVTVELPAPPTGCGIPRVRGAARGTIPRRRRVGVPPAADSLGRVSARTRSGRRHSRSRVVGL